MVLDSLDGRVARMTKTQSDFGAEYDSLADMVSFGAAPALVIYEWSLRGLGRWGWVAAFVYVAGAALRLARFNTNIGVVDKRYFQGIPSPAAAALVAGFVWVFDDLRYDRHATSAWPSWIVTVYAGLSMVSNSPFYSFKVFNLKKSVPFIAVVLDRARVRGRLERSAEVAVRHVRRLRAVRPPAVAVATRAPRAGVAGRAGRADGAVKQRRNTPLAARGARGTVRPMTLRPHSPSSAAAPLAALLALAIEDFRAR